MGHTGKLPTKVRKCLLCWQYSVVVYCAGRESGISEGRRSLQEAGEGHWQAPEIFVLGRSLQAKMSRTKVALRGWNPGVSGRQGLCIPPKDFHF